LFGASASHRQGEIAVKFTSICRLQCCGLVLAITLAGCAATSHVITGQPRDPIDPAQVSLYTKAPPKYEEIAIVEASSRNSFSFGDQAKMDAVIARLKEAAASLGANGIILQNTSSERGPAGVGTGVGVSSGGGTYVSTGIYTSTSSKTGQGLAIHVPAE
jgi:hypothetical protein